jgi:hypothetical protein
MIHLAIDSKHNTACGHFEKGDWTTVKYASVTCTECKMPDAIKKYQNYMNSLNQISKEIIAGQGKIKS